MFVLIYPKSISPVDRVIQVDPSTMLSGLTNAAASTQDAAGQGGGGAATMSTLTIVGAVLAVVVLVGGKQKDRKKKGGKKKKKGEKVRKNLKLVSTSWVEKFTLIFYSIPPS